MSFEVRYTSGARQDLKRLYSFLLDRCESAEDLDAAEKALDSVVRAVGGLCEAPFICRKAGTSPFLRELVIPFGNSGYVALFEIEDAATVTVLALRHQREDDYL